GEAIAPLAGIQHQHAAAGAGQLQAGRHAGVAAADNDHVEIRLWDVHEDLRECCRRRRLKSVASSASVTLPRRFTSSASASWKASASAPVTACSTRQAGLSVRWPMANTGGAPTA